jgi:hypothetical protein
VSLTGITTPVIAKLVRDRRNERRKEYGSFDFRPDVALRALMQYVPEPYERLAGLIQLGAPWMFFAGTMFNELDRDFVTVQTSRLSSNGPGPMPRGYSDKTVSYPHTTMSFPGFNAQMSMEHSLEWVFEELSGRYLINNERIIGRGLLCAGK